MVDGSLRQNCTSLEDYLERRGWIVPEESHDHAISLISHVLTAPLSLPLDCSSVVCLGARSESQLPVHYWQERPDVRQIDLVGPEMTPQQGRAGTTTGQTLRWPHRGLYHEWADAPACDYDAYVLFNPGIGHEHLRESWKPTLDMLLQKVLVCTAHSERDAERDQKEWKHSYGMDVDYIVNPWASRIAYLDPLSPTEHWVRPNAFIATISR